MCGICGAIQIHGEPRQVLAPAVLARMTDLMTHRGPNDRGTYAAPGVALGVRRLSIVDVDGGHQPFTNERSEVWAVQNGELYNHQALRDELQTQGHSFRTRCDTEILPHLYEEAGPAFEEELRGMFGIAIWDQRRRRAVLARDRLGIKPLYWAQVDDLVLFASELKSLLASGLIDADLDYDAIDAYLTLGFVPGPRTPLAQVSKLLPGHRLVVADEAVRIERYWSYPEPVVDTPALAAEDYIGGLGDVLDEAVRLRLMSDVPLGAMLSGGLDSSLVVALMARHMSEPVKTFSIGFSDDPQDGNELTDAREVASLFGTDHHELELSYKDDTLDLEDLVWSLDEPLADLSALGFAALSQLASRHVSVALSGQGADELLGGYTKHRAASLVGRLGPLRPTARRVVTGLAARGPLRVRRSARTLAAPDPVNRLIEMSGRLGGGLRGSLYRGPLEGRTGVAAYESVRAALAGVADDPLPATLHIDAQLALVDSMLHYFDRTSMAYSLEARVPFLDHHVVEYCSRIPSDLKVRRLQTKYVLKRAAEGILPPRIVHKRKLAFFRGSTAGWLQAQLQRAALDRLLGADARCSEFLESATVQRLASAHRDGHERANAHLLTAIVMLEIWLSTYLPRAIPPSTGSSRELTTVN